MSAQRIKTTLAATLVSLVAASCALSEPAKPRIVEPNNRSPFMRGIPPTADRVVTATLDWARSYEQVLWANQNVSKILAVAPISRGVGEVTPLAYADRDLKDQLFEGLTGEAEPLTSLLKQVHVDGAIILKDGIVQTELYFNGMRPDSRHQLNSATKSFVGLLIGILVDEGTLDPNLPFAERFPELKDAGVADGTLRDALDMALRVQWPMSWEPDDYRILTFEAGGFSGRRPEFPYANTLELIATAPKAGEHGSHYLYASVNTEMLAWSISRATGRNWQDVLSERLWSKLGAERDAYVIVDPGGHGFGTAGMSASLRDLARFGLMIENDGYFNGQQIVPASWIGDTVAGDDRVRSNMKDQRDIESYGEGLFYRNQFRVLNSDEGELIARGGIGQTVYVNQKHGLVGVFLASAFERAHNVFPVKIMRQLRDGMGAQ